MISHIVIWSGEDECYAKSFADGLVNNQWENVRILCASPLFQVFLDRKVSCSSIPKDQTVEEWKKTFLNAYHEMAQKTPIGQILEHVFVHLITFPQNSGEVHSFVEVLHEAGEKVTKDFTLHIVMLMDTISHECQKQRQALNAFREDVISWEKCQTTHKAERKAELEKLDAERERALSRVTSRNENEIRSIHESYAVKIEEKGAEIDRKFLIDGYHGVKWECLSLLSNYDSNGSADPRIQEIRRDILCGVVMKANDYWEYDENGKVKKFQSFAFEIQRSSFSKADLERLPYYLAKQRLLNQNILLEDAKEKLLPDCDKLEKQFHDEISDKCGLLNDALLLDDENYNNRSANGLWNTFQEYNPVFYACDTIIKEAVDQWTEDVKSQLSYWCYVNQDVRSFIKNNLKTEIIKIIQNYKDEKTNDSSISGLQFGKHVSRRKRHKDIKRVVEYAINEMVYNSCLSAMERMQDQIPEFLTYLSIMDKGNEEFFKGYSEHIINVMNDTDWMNAVMRALSGFPPQDTALANVNTQNYKGWLSQYIDKYFLSRIDPGARDEAEKQFNTLALTDADNDKEAFIMLNRELNPIADKKSFCFLGASAKLYHLFVCKWYMQNASFDCFLGEGTAGTSADKTIIMVDQEGGKERKDLKIRYKQENVEFYVSWDWPAASEKIDMDVMDGKGAVLESHTIMRDFMYDEGNNRGKCVLYANDLYLYGTLRIRIYHDNWFDEKNDVKVDFSGYRGSPEEERGLCKFFPSPLFQFNLDIEPDILPHLGATSSDEIVLKLNTYRGDYYYPLPKKTQKMLLLCSEDMGVPQVYFVKRNAKQRR